MSMRSFTIEEYRMLADLEQRMDSGEQPFVVNGGGRMAIEKDLMEEFGQVSGQTVSHILTVAIIKARLAMLKTQIELNRISNTAAATQGGDNES